MSKVIPLLVTALLLSAAVPSAAASQSDNPLFGTWEAKTKEGIRTVIIRADSSASYGDETVRWRLQKDVMWLALGGEWVDYRFKLRGKRRMTLSGGDLTEPITLNRIGAPTPRPSDTPVPPDPDLDQRPPLTKKG